MTTIKTVADLEREVCVNCDVCWASTHHGDCGCGWWRHFQRKRQAVEAFYNKQEALLERALVTDVCSRKGDEAAYALYCEAKISANNLYHQRIGKLYNA